MKPFADWKLTAQKKGWIDDEKALEWLHKVFLPLTEPTDRKERRLLVADGHHSHATIDNI